MPDQKTKSFCDHQALPAKYSLSEKWPQDRSQIQGPITKTCQGKDEVNDITVKVLRLQKDLGWCLLNLCRQTKV